MPHQLPNPITHLAVFVCLILLTVLTVATSFWAVGMWHTVIASSIAVTKAALVGLFFMELRQHEPLNWLALGGGVFWLGILFVLTLADYWTRGWVAY